MVIAKGASGVPVVQAARDREVWFMIEAIFTIVGTIVGFALSELATIIREGRSEKRQSKSNAI